MKIDFLLDDGQVLPVEIDDEDSLDITVELRGWHHEQSARRLEGRQVRF